VVEVERAWPWATTRLPSQMRAPVVEREGGNGQLWTRTNTGQTNDL